MCVLDYDFAILRLTRPIPLTSRLYPACLPNPGDDQGFDNSTILNVSGWGYTNKKIGILEFDSWSEWTNYFLGWRPDKLYATKMSPVPNDYCNKMHGMKKKEKIEAYYNITDNLLCATGLKKWKKRTQGIDEGTASTCYGDDGGKVTLN